MAIYFVTSNENKLKEAEAILKRRINQINLEIDVEKVVKDKARKAFKIIKKPVLVEDTAFCIEAWNNFPGALIKWMLKTIGNKGICKLQKEKNRNIIVKTCYCLYNGKKFNIFIGELKGKIPLEPKGKTGFGWDPIFVPDGHKKSFAEMSREEKNQISMRKIALEKLRKFLKS